MKEDPNITLLGSLIGDPTRANILNTLMNGMALTATELANIAGVTAQTASSHLKKLEEGGLIKRQKQGRHQYFCLSDNDVANVLENLMELAELKGHVRIRTGPKDPDLRKARVCYNHLAGEMGVQMFDSLVSRNFIMLHQDECFLTQTGQSFVDRLGLNVKALSRTRRPLCKPCLDWSARRNHLAGALGTAFFNHFIELGWIKRKKNTRIVKFTREGELQFLNIFPQ